MQATDDPGEPLDRGERAPRHPGPEESPGGAPEAVIDTAAIDTAAIDRVVGRARRRIRGQWALEGATTALIVASAAALAVVFLMRLEAVSRPTGIALLAGTLAVVVAGALLGASRRLDDERVARRIDRASNLADRLSTAIAFRGTMPPGAGAAGPHADETHALMRAAIRDGVRAVPRADVALATPFVAPGDLRAALGFLAISALAAGLALPTPDRAPRLYRAEPDHAAAGDDVVLKGRNLLTGVARPIAALPTRSSIGVPDAPSSAMSPSVVHGFVPADAGVTIGPGKAHPARVLDWSADQIVVRIPADAPVGPTTLTAWIGDDAVGPVAFTVVDRKDPAYHKEGSVALDPDDRAYLDALLAEIKAIARRDKVPELEDFAKQIEQLLRDAELGKISKEQLLDALAKAEDKMNKDAEPDQAELDKQLADLGKELSKDQMTKELGDALQNNQLEKAQQELEKLAEKLDKKELSDKEKEQLGKQLDKVAKQMDQKDKQSEQKQQQMQQKLQDEIRRLEKKKQEAKTEKEQLDAERQLNKKKDELKKLEKDREDKEQSAQRQALKRLSRDMEKAAENLQKPEKDPKDPKNQQEQEQRDQQASQKLKDAARETGRVDRDQRKQATQKKMSSQMEDLREAMRRAKQKGNKGDKDPFGKQGKNQDFAQRARGQKGHGQAWKPGQQPGQGQGQGQGQNGQGGQGQQPGGKEWGTGHDDNLVGDPTDPSGNTKDDDLQGKQGKDGGGTRETILAAAQKGFASQRYRDVYGKYQQIVEDVMRTEKLPSSYKYYVKKYFAKIHPTTAAETAPTNHDAPAPAAPKD
ncbi:MAG TPA: hypothetical protein VFT22_37480 [Kofleriaceae bacterium]|nr:hypothetical protein [Kofleriaceae bacterium]